MVNQPPKIHSQQDKNHSDDKCFEEDDEITQQTGIDNGSIKNAQFNNETKILKDSSSVPASKSDIKKPRSPMITRAETRDTQTEVEPNNKPAVPETRESFVEFKTISFDLKDS